MRARSGLKANAAVAWLLQRGLKGAALASVLLCAGIAAAETGPSSPPSELAPPRMLVSVDPGAAPLGAAADPGSLLSAPPSQEGNASGLAPQEGLGPGALPNAGAIEAKPPPLALSDELQALHAPTAVYVVVSRSAMDRPGAELIAAALARNITTRGWARMAPSPQEANVLIEVVTRFDPNDQWRTYRLRLETALNGVPVPAASGFEAQLDRRPGIFCSSVRCRAEFVAERLVPVIEQNATLDRIAEVVAAQRAALLAEAVDRAAQAAQAAREAAERESERIAAVQEDLAAREAAIAQDPQASEQAQSSQSDISSLLAPLVFGGLAAWLGVFLIRAARGGGKKPDLSRPSAAAHASARAASPAPRPAAEATPSTSSTPNEQERRSRRLMLQTYGGGLGLAVAFFSFLWSAPPVRDSVCSMELGQPGLANACCVWGFTEKEVAHAVSFTPLDTAVQLEGYISQAAIGFSTEQEARADALARLQGEAQVLCARRDPEFERLMNVDASPVEFQCANGPAGWSCALKYQANCQIERREQIERCPGVPGDAPAASGELSGAPQGSMASRI